ncbi:MAG TPA: IS1595 family transposase [Acidobacteriaceae bacterium]|jgi:transposase-like protein|nr:IS1595 family transposase [Acidobacteriaceae bacterium]
MKNEVKTLSDAIRYFADDQVCVDTVAAMRWPNGPVCPQCASGELRQHWLKAQKRWQCRDCGKQYSVKVNTIFEDSALKLDKWLTAMWMLANCKNGVSSYEISRSVGVTQKSAWFMLHRIREAMKKKSLLKMGNTGGPVEVDEAFIGGTPKFMHAKRRMSLGTGIGGRTAKVPILGMLDRESRQVRTEVVPNVKRETLQNAILREIQAGSTIYTDNASTFDSLGVKAYVHDTVNHVEEYVRGQVHTQGIENFWSLLKRTLKGTYVAVEPFHLDAYADEQCFRFNNRATKDNPLDDQDRFLAPLSQVSGKGLTYAELTGKVGETAF